MKCIFFLLLFVSVCAIAQDKKISIEQLNFMAGKWVLAHQWGDMEEIWSRAMGNNMMCTYRCVKNDKVVFYEFIVIEQSDSVPVMRLRHFYPGSIGWEDRQGAYNYPLKELNNNKAVFERPDGKTRLIYERKSATELFTVLEQQDKNGELKREEFGYTLAKEK